MMPCLRGDTDFINLSHLKKRLTDNVWSLCVVWELILFFVFTVLVERALVAGLQNPMQKLKSVQAGTQAIDPEGLLVALDGPTDVCFAYGPKVQRSGLGHNKNLTLASVVLMLTNALTFILLFQNVQRCASLWNVVIHL